MARGGAASSSREGAVQPGGLPLVRIGPFGPTHPARYRVVTPEEQAAADYYAAAQQGGAHFVPPQQAPQAWLAYGQGPGAPRQERERPQPVYRTIARDLKPLDADRDQAQWCCAGCNLLNWPSRRRCRECKARRTGQDPREWARQEGRAASPPRRHRRRDSERRATPSPPSPPSVERPRSRDGRAAGAGASPTGDKRAAAVREALASLKLAQAPASVLGPLHAELERLEAAARVARPIGQRLDAARSAMRRAEARMASTGTALAAATERHDKAAQHLAACAEELAALEEELRSGQADNQADDLVEAVEAALKNPAAAYSHATLQAAFARYAENKKDKVKDREGDAVRSPPKAAPKVVRSPVAKRMPAQPLSPDEARDVASGASAALTLALADRSAMGEDGQGNDEETEEADALGAKRLRQGGGPGQ